MKNADVAGYRHRSDAVFGTLALDLIAEPLDRHGGLGGMNRIQSAVTLIDMRDGADTLLSCEPLSNVLFNKVLRLRATSEPRSHGNYLPALEAAASALERDVANQNCAMLLLFLSDGKPSDQFGGHSPASVRAYIPTKMAEIAARFGSRLTVGTIGFGDPQEDFSVLQNMVLEARQAGASAWSCFQHASLDSHKLSVAMSSLVSSLQQSSVVLTMSQQAAGRIVRSVSKEDFSSSSTASKNDGWRIYRHRIIHWKWTPNPAMIEYPWIEVENAPAGIAIREKCFAEGAERFAFQFATLDKDDKELDHSLIAKESRYLNPDDRNFVDLQLKSHRLFCQTQHVAQQIALAFNAAVHQLVNSHKISAADQAKIEFLECSVYTYVETQPGPAFGIELGVLVEKRLDQTRYKKWNGNDGSIENMSGMQNLQVRVFWFPSKPS